MKKIFLVAALFLFYTLNLSSQAFAGNSDTAMSCVEYGETKQYDLQIQACSMFLEEVLRWDESGSQKQVRDLLGGIYYQRGKAYLLTDQIDKGVKDLTASIQNKPNENTYLWRAETYCNRMGEYDKGIDDLTRSIALDPDNYQAYQSRGSCHLSKLEYDKAIADFTRAIEIDPSQESLYENRAEVQVMKGKYEEALKDYDKAIKIKADNSAAYLARGDVYLRMKKYDQALKDYNTAIDIDPKNSKTFSGRADVYLVKKQYSVAADDFDKAIILNANNCDAYFGMGLLSFQLSQNDKALEHWMKSIECDRFPSRYGAVTAIIDANRRKFTDAMLISFYSKVIQTMPAELFTSPILGYVDAYFQRGASFNKSGKYLEAIEDFSRFISVDPQQHRGAAYFLRGMAYGAVRQYGQGIDDLTKAIGVTMNQHDKGVGYITRGIYFNVSGQYDKALGDNT